MTTNRDVWALPHVYAGARSPQGLIVTIQRCASEVVDFASVTSVRLRVVIEATGQERTWDTTIVQRWADQLKVRHEFADDGTDTVQTGRYRILPELMYYTDGPTPEDPPVLIGVRRAAPFYMAVRQ